MSIPKVKEKEKDGIGVNIGVVIPIPELFHRVYNKHRKVYIRPKLKYFSSRLAVVFAQYIEAKC